MNKTDRASIFIVCLFYVITLACGYIIFTKHLDDKKMQGNTLVLTINSHEINSENSSTVVYEDRGAAQPIKKVYDTGSILIVSSIYEQQGYELMHITEFMKKVLDQEVLVTRMWFSKAN